MTALISRGESTESAEMALMNALGPVKAQIAEAENYLIYVEGIEHTDAGYVATVRIVFLEVEDVKKLKRPERARDADEKAPGKTQVGADDRQSLIELAAHYSHYQLERDQQQVMDQTYEEIAHPLDQTSNNLPEDFEQVAHSDASYVHPTASNDDSTHIVTKLDNWQIADTSTYELLSSDDVRWRDIQPGNENVPTPEDPEKPQKTAKNEINLPKDDGLNLVA